MNPSTLVDLCLLHFIADFVLQSREMAQKKSTRYSWLFAHLNIQFWVFFILIYLIIHPDWYISFKFALINAIIHGLIDWNIWKFYKISVHYRINYGVDSLCDQSIPEKWRYFEDHWFYLTIGFDQFLHVSTLILLAGWLL